MFFREDMMLKRQLSLTVTPDKSLCQPSECSRQQSADREVQLLRLLLLKLHKSPSVQKRPLWLHLLERFLVVELLWQLPLYCSNLYFNWQNRTVKCLWCTMGINLERQHVLTKKEKNVMRVIYQAADKKNGVCLISPIDIFDFSILTFPIFVILP